MQEPDLKIKVNDLSREMADQAGNYFYIAECAVKAETTYNTEKYNLEQVTAELDCQIRAKYEMESKKVTEKVVEMEIGRHTMFKSQRVAILKSKANMDMWKAKREAWYARKDMLVQLAIKERGDVEALNRTISAQG
jgi:hypothetical protein